MTDGPTAAPLLLIDALNVAYWRGAPPSLRLPLVLAAGLLACGHPTRMIFDASTPFRLPPHEQDAYRRLLAKPELALAVASGVPADRQLLRLARASGAVIISRDRFREHRARYRRLIDNPDRLLGGHVSADALLLPDLDLALPLLPLGDALRRLQVGGAEDVSGN